MEEVRKRRQLTPEEKLQIYKEAILARSQGNGAVAQVLKGEKERLERTVIEQAAELA